MIFHFLLKKNIYICTHSLTVTHTYCNRYTNAHTQIIIYYSTQTYAYTDIRRHTLTFTHTYIYIRTINAHTYTYIYTHIHLYTYTHKPTHTNIHICRHYNFYLNMFL